LAHILTNVNKQYQHTGKQGSAVADKPARRAAARGITANVLQTTWTLSVINLRPS